MGRISILLVSFSLVASTVGTTSVFAENNKEKPKAEAAAPAKPTEQQQKAFVDQVKQNLVALNLQQVTAQVLGMQYQKELNNLQQMQAVFSDTYKLDVTKLRQGKYQFDEKSGKFNEVSGTSVATAQP